MTHCEKKKQAIWMAAYKKGVEWHKSGKPDVNIFSYADKMEYCAFSGGYYDSMRGLA